MPENGEDECVLAGVEKDWDLDTLRNIRCYSECASELSGTYLFFSVCLCAHIHVWVPMSSVRGSEGST